MNSRSHIPQSLGNSERSITIDQNETCTQLPTKYCANNNSTLDSKQLTGETVAGILPLLPANDSTLFQLKQYERNSENYIENNEEQFSTLAFEDMDKNDGNEEIENMEDSDTSSNNDKDPDYNSSEDNTEGVRNDDTLDISENPCSGDPLVNDLKAIKYTPNKEIFIKLSYTDEWSLLNKCFNKNVMPVSNTSAKFVF